MKTPSRRLYPIYMLFAAAAFAADDPAGWTAAKWGMSVDQVRAAIADSVPLTGPETDRKIDARLSPLGIREIKLGPATFTAFFLFDAAGQLDEVVFEAIAPTSSAFVDLVLALSQKYGRPIERQEARNRTAQWTFPTTAIDLRLTDLTPKIQFHSLWLTYRKPAATRL